MVTVISLFAGCGGSSLGYKWAGFKELLAVEWDKNAVETFQLNFPEVPVWQRDICSVTGKEILKFCKIKKGELSVLDGSPPCQGFSTEGKRNVLDPRNDLFKEYSRLLKELQPKVFVMENVSGMIKGTMKGMFLEIISELKSCGYNVKVKLMNAMWYDVPQNRQRLIFIGLRQDLQIDPVFPPPNNYFITSKNALQNCPVSEIKQPRHLLLYDYIKPGKNAGTISQNIKNKYGYNATLFSISKLHPNKPCNTICKSVMSGTSSILHWSEKRVLSVSELKRLQSLPDDFILTGNVADQIARIGNSVPPKMMYHIAKTIKEKILDMSNADKETPKAPAKGTSLKESEETV